MRLRGPGGSGPIAHGINRVNNLPLRSSRVSVQHPFEYHNSQHPHQHGQHAPRHHHHHHGHHHHHEPQRNGVRKTSIKNGQRHLKNAEGVSAFSSISGVFSLFSMSGQAEASPFLIR